MLTPRPSVTELMRLANDFSLVIDHHVCTKLTAVFELRWTARRCEDERAFGMGKLNRRRTDTAAACMDQDRLVSVQATQLKQIHVSRHKCFRDCRRFFIADLFRDAHRDSRWNNGILGIRAACDDCHHSVAGLPGIYALHDFSC